MKKVIKYPCSYCMKLEDGTIISTKKALKDKFTQVYFKLDRCGIEHVIIWSDLEVKHYIKEV